MFSKEEEASVEIAIIKSLFDLLQTSSLSESPLCLSMKSDILVIPLL